MVEPAATMATSNSRLLSLPRELRDQIWSHSLFAEDGYTCDFDAGKLRMADGSPICLDLMYTCRLVAAKTRGLALRVNAVIFTTLYSDNLRPRAGRWTCTSSTSLYALLPPAYLPSASMG